jgi:hypothetical protein
MTGYEGIHVRFICVGRDLGNIINTQEHMQVWATCSPPYEVVSKIAVKK